MNQTTLAKNRIASAALIAISGILLTAAWFSAPVRHVDHTLAEGDTAITLDAAPTLSAPPARVEKLWTTPASVLTEPAPMVVAGVLIIPESHGARAVVPATGEELWHYRRDRLLCAATTSRQLVVLTFEGPAGCSETVSLQPATGEYRATRRSSGIDNVQPLRSNTYSGVYSESFLELWRDDLVRVVEYGRVPAPQEPDLQPHPECRIVSAATRTELLAVLNKCDQQHRLVLQEANPEESRSPEVLADIELGSSADAAANAQIVAIGQSAAALVTGDIVTSYGEDGKALSSTNIRAKASTAAAPVPPRPEMAMPLTADLPHHMTWLSPYGLVGFEPKNLEFRFIFPEAIGTGVAIGGSLVFPTQQGLAIANWQTGQVDREIPLPGRLSSAPPAEPGAQPQPSTPQAQPQAQPQGTKKPVTLAVTGNILLESDGAHITAYALS